MHHHIVLWRVLAVLVSCLAYSLSASSQQKLKIATEGANPPFSTITSAGKIEGLDIELAQAFCAKMSIECEIVAQDWDGIIPALLAKKYDAVVASMSITEDRKKVVSFSKPYYKSPSVFVTRKGKGALSIAPEALRGKSIGVQGASVHAAYLEDRYNRSNLRLYNTVADAYRDLSAGRVEFVLYDKLAIFDWLKSQEGSCCEIVGPDLNDAAYFGSGVGIAIRKGETELLQKFNAAIEGVIADGTYATITRKYFPFPIN